METIERRSERPAQRENSFGNDDTGPDPAQAAAESLLSAANAAISRALSTNSEAYLARMRQGGGE